MRLFVDTGAFIALVDADDQNHDAAKSFFRDMTNEGARFITTNFVVCETMNFLKARVSHQAAVAFLEGLRKSGRFEVVSIDRSSEDTAFGIFKDYGDKGFSFTDCTSFAVMKSLKVSKAFAFDRHFGQIFGFARLPQDRVQPR